MTASEGRLGVVKPRAVHLQYAHLCPPLDEVSVGLLYQQFIPPILDHYRHSSAESTLFTDLIFPS